MELKSHLLTKFYWSRGSVHTLWMQIVKGHEYQEVRFVENYLRSLPTTMGTEILFSSSSQISKHLFLFFF